MGFLFNELIYRPLYNLLVFVYNVLPFADFGVAIIVVTVIIKFLLVPLSRKQIESQKKMAELQPKIRELQKKYKQDKEKQTKAILELYKTHKTNPFSGCLPLILQLVFLIAIYRVLFNISNAGLQVSGDILYPGIDDPGRVSQYFLGIIDMSKSLDLKHITINNIPHILLIILAAASQYIQTKMLMAKQTLPSPGNSDDFGQILSKQMLYLGPVLTLFIGFQFPAGLSLYWLVSTFFMIAQQYYLEHKNKPVIEN